MTVTWLVYLFLRNSLKPCGNDYSQLTVFQLTVFQLTVFQLTVFQLTLPQVSGWLPLQSNWLAAIPVFALCMVVP